MALPIKSFPDYTIDEAGNVWSTKTNKYLKPAYNKGGGYLWKYVKGE